MNKKLITLLIILTFLFVACNSGGEEPTVGSDNDTMEMEGDDHHDDDDHHHDDDHSERIDNPDGASIAITSPTAGETFAEGDSIRVEVDVENFALAEDGSHWHVYVDGTSFGMITGNVENSTLNGVEAGERMIEVYLANGDHIEFKEGGSVMITVE